MGFISQNLLEDLELEKKIIIINANALPSILSIVNVSVNPVLSDKYAKEIFYHLIVAKLNCSEH